MDRVVFDRRFEGPPGSVNGGYGCGVAAELVGEPASVRLVRRPPLEVPLAVSRVEDRVVLLEGDNPVIEAVRSNLEIQPPEPVNVQDAMSASTGYAGFSVHPFPGCFVCGPDRAEGDGLRIFPGLVAGRDVLAATWTPAREFAGDDGVVRPELVWAALDCPSGWAGGLLGARTTVLGTLEARRLRDVHAGDTVVMIGWPIGREGRKDFVASAMYAADGILLAEARATWIAIKDE